MSKYKIFCDSCEAEYTVTPVAGDTHNEPVHCSYCGSELTDENVGTHEEDDIDEEWEKLLEEDIDDWKLEEDDK
jgi:hypothetical protein